MARKRTGQLIRRKSGWYARVLVRVDGVPTRKCFELGTKYRAVAQLKLARLIANLKDEELSLGDATQQAAAAETVDEVASVFFEGRVAQGLRSAKTEARWYELYWRDAIGKIPLSEVRSHDIRSVLKECADGNLLGAKGNRLSGQSIAHIRGVANRLFDAAWQDELIDKNPVARVKLRSIMPRETEKPRTVPTDAEVRALLSHPDVDLELKMLVLLSRTVGGMRSGDLNKLRWEMFGPGFVTCCVPRSKTGRPQELEVPGPVQRFMDAWWQVQGRPKAGLVFPKRRGPDAGVGPKSEGISYARRLRRGLLTAGVDRYELHHESETSLPTDFHSIRRAYVTALARGGVNAQVAQVLTGHSDPKVHQKYVAAATITALPESAMLQLDTAWANQKASPLPEPTKRGERKTVPQTKKPGASRRVSLVGHEGLEPSANGLRVHCSTN